MMRRIWVLPILALLFASCQKSSDVLVVDYKMNVASPDYDANYFNWSFGEKKIEDKFDTVSQASLKKSTGEFNAVRYAGRAEDKKLTLPAGLRGLFLYAVADWSLVEGDALNVEKRGGSIVVRFAHHGKAYELVTDANGNFDVLKDAKIAKDFAELDENKQYIIKDEYLLEGDASMMKNLNWEALPFKEDKYSEGAQYHFEGTLKMEFENNVLHIHGSLVKK